jgi:endonuclease I
MPLKRLPALAAALLLGTAAVVSAQTFRPLGPLELALPDAPLSVAPLAAAESPSLSALAPLGLESLGTPLSAPEALPTLSAAPERGRAAYLGEAAGLEGRRLLFALQRIVSRNFRPLDYDRAKRFMFTAADFVDRREGSGIVDAYTGEFIRGRWADGEIYGPDGESVEAMNPEHLWPQSLFNGQQPMRSDVHHLMPVSSKINSDRSSLPFGEVEGSNGSAATDGVYFEPPDSAKGRVARAMLYFYVHYHDRGIMRKNSASRFWNPQVATLLQWNRRFPPTEEERRRNDLIEGVQYNRNPFVDDPGLADRMGLDGFLVPNEGRRADDDPRPKKNNRSSYDKRDPQSRSASVRRQKERRVERRFRGDRWNSR